MVSSRIELHCNIPVASIMKLGANRNLFLQRTDSPDFYRIGSASGFAQIFIQAGVRVSYFNFDQNVLIYSGGKTEGLYITDPGDGYGKNRGTLLWT